MSEDDVQEKEILTENITEEEIQQFKKELKLLDVSDVMKITGWAEATVRAIMQEDDFPVIKIGKKNQVSLDGLKEYLKHRRVTR